MLQVIYRIPFLTRICETFFETTKIPLTRSLEWSPADGRTRNIRRVGFRFSTFSIPSIQATMSLKPSSPGRSRRTSSRRCLFRWIRRPPVTFHKRGWLRMWKRPKKCARSPSVWRKGSHDWKIKVIWSSTTWIFPTTFELSVKNCVFSFRDLISESNSSKTKKNLLHSF